MEYNCISFLVKSDNYYCASFLVHSDDMTDYIPRQYRIWNHERGDPRYMYPTSCDLHRDSTRLKNKCNIYPIANQTKWGTICIFLGYVFTFLSHDQNTIHAERGCVEMCNFCLAGLIFLMIGILGHEVKARTHTYAEIMHFPMRCIISAWEAWGRRLSVFEVMMMHQAGKCVILA